MLATKQATTQKAAVPAPASRSAVRVPEAQAGSEAYLQRNLGNRLFREIAPLGGPRLQRACACGGSCANCSVRDDEIAPLQPALKVGPANDRYEREADRVADTVMRMPAPALQRQPMEEEEEMIQAKPLATRITPLVQRKTVEDDVEERTPRMVRAKAQPGHTPRVTPEVAGTIRALQQSAGRPMAQASRAFFEPRFGADFSQVRIHIGPRAAEAAEAVQARAFTLGRDVVFGASEYAPGSTAGQRLFAHELTHVVQQGGASRSAGPAPPIARMQRSEVVQRAISPELGKIESYLSYGLFDWAIRDKEAIQALELLKSLPRYQQAVFFANSKYLGRLRSNLPKDRVQELNDLQAAAATIAPPTDTVTGIRSRLSTGLFDWAVTDKDATEALDMLKQLSGNQLAVALGAIDYGRLMDNLPDNRKKELIDLLARGLSTGATRDKEEKAHPGTLINSLAFKSDHGILKDQTKNWSATGTPYSQPEWSLSKGKAVSHPISHNKDATVDIDLNLDVTPITAPTAPIKIIGKSPSGYLDFSHTGTMQGGQGQTVSMASSAKLPNKITTLENEQITWIMEWRNWKREIGRTAHTVFLTAGMPHLPSDVTHKRLALAIELAKQAQTIDAHELVRSIMIRWPIYNLDVFYSDAWQLARNMKKGADCGTIVRFVQGLVQILGLPGTAKAMMVYADPTGGSSTGLVAKEDEWGMVSDPGLWKYGARNIGGKDAGAALIDGGECNNSYEGALKYDDGSTLRYYPGGVSFSYSGSRVEYKTAQDVLHIFQCLAWVSYEGGKHIAELVTNYPKTVSVPFPKHAYSTGDRLGCA